MPAMHPFWPFLGQKAPCPGLIKAEQGGVGAVLGNTGAERCPPMSDVFTSTQHIPGSERVDSCPSHTYLLSMALHVCVYVCEMW